MSPPCVGAIGGQGVRIWKPGIDYRRDPKSSASPYTDKGRASSYYWDVTPPTVFTRGQGEGRETCLIGEGRDGHIWQVWVRAAGNCHMR